jgi:hypothetical protein
MSLMNYFQHFTEALVEEVSDFLLKPKAKKSRENMDYFERQQTPSVASWMQPSLSGRVANDNT